MKYGEIITETPYLNREELPYKPMTGISTNRLALSYEKMAELEGKIEIYKNKSSNAIITGTIDGDSFLTAVVIQNRPIPYPVEPTLLDNVRQVSMVNVASGSELAGITKATYNAVAKIYDLVSDHEQYLGAQGLWKSLARESDVHIYVFDGTVNDYIRDRAGDALKYNGKNISDSTIWGQTEMYKTVLLVATTKEL